MRFISLVTTHGVDVLSKIQFAVNNDAEISIRVNALTLQHEVKQLLSNRCPIFHNHSKLLKLSLKMRKIVN